jgi:hypothetical protein
MVRRKWRHGASSPQAFEFEAKPSPHFWPLALAHPREAKRWRNSRAGSSEMQMICWPKTPRGRFRYSRPSLAPLEPALQQKARQGLRFSVRGWPRQIYAFPT